jgi:hypothetical protein
VAGRKIIADTSGIIALLDRDDQYHSETANDKPQDDVARVWEKWFEGVDLLQVKPTEPATEYQQLLLMIIYEIEENDYRRLFELMERYRDRPMDLADATLVLTAEKTGYRQILTLDSDFLFYRIGGRDNFEIIQVQSKKGIIRPPSPPKFGGERSSKSPRIGGLRGQCKNEDSIEKLTNGETEGCLRDLSLMCS